MATQPQLPTFSPLVFFTLASIFVVSLIVFFSLTRRWTVHRSRAMLEDWADERGYTVLEPQLESLPHALERLRTINPTIESILRKKGDTLLRFRIGENATFFWHLLVRATHDAHPAAALISATARQNAAELFQLSAYPAVLSNDRFTVWANESRAARMMADAPTRGLLPADISYLTVGNLIILDFTPRPFDPIEFDRMITVMEQIIRK